MNGKHIESMKTTAITFFHVKFIYLNIHLIKSLHITFLLFLYHVNFNTITT
ncbi:hypothetical protein EMIT019CA3_110077 [Bacillus pseudomycoides]